MTKRRTNPTCQSAVVHFLICACIQSVAKVHPEPGAFTTLWCDHNHCDDSCRSSRTFNGAIMIIAMTMQRLTWIQRSWSSSFIINMFLKVVIIFAFQCLNVFNLFSLVIQTLKKQQHLVLLLTLGMVASWSQIRRFSTWFNFSWFFTWDLREGNI